MCELFDHNIDVINHVSFIDETNLKFEEVNHWLAGVESLKT